MNNLQSSPQSSLISRKVVWNIENVKKNPFNSLKVGKQKVGQILNNFHNKTENKHSTKT